MTDELGDLYPDEQVLWTGSPARVPLITRADLVLIAWGLVVGAVAYLTFWRAGVAAHGAPPFVRVFGGLFLLAILYSMFGGLVTSWVSLRGTRYLVTDRRVIARSTAWGRRLEVSAYLKDLPPPVLTNRNGSMGTIRFGGSTLFGEIVERNSLVAPRSRTTPVRPVLTEIADAQRVRDLIATAQAAHNT